MRGNADERGSDEYNLAPVERAFRPKLLVRFYSCGRLARSVRQEFPFDPARRTAWAKNRRAHFVGRAKVTCEFSGFRRSDVSTGWQVVAGRRSRAIPPAMAEARPPAVLANAILQEQQQQLMQCSARRDSMKALTTASTAGGGRARPSPSRKCSLTTSRGRRILRRKATIERPDVVDDQDSSRYADDSLTRRPPRTATVDPPTAAKTGATHPRDAAAPPPTVPLAGVRTVVCGLHGGKWDLGWPGSRNTSVPTESPLEDDAR